MKVHDGVEVYLHVFLASALDRKRQKTKKPRKKLTIMEGRNKK
jgi:hypothetical protein